jgi:translocation and assembly module TamA
MSQNLPYLIGTRRKPCSAGNLGLIWLFLSRVVNLGEFAVRRFACLLQALAPLLILCGEAEARTARIALTVNGDERMSEDLKQLVEDFEKAQPLSGDSLALLQGAQALRGRVNTAMRSRGFYDARVAATIDNRPIDEAAALDAIESRPEAEQIAFSFTIDTGPVFKVGSVVVRSPGPAPLPAIDMSKIGLAAGDPAQAAAILQAQDRMLDQFRKQGYALAAVRREVVVDHATREAEVTFTVQTGPVAKMGPVRFSGSEKVDMMYLQRRVPFKQGDPYDPAKVEELRGKLNSLGVFNAIRIKPATALDANGELPFDVELTDRLQRSFGFGISYETQLGFAVSGFWVHRNLFGEAESLRLTAEINHIGQGEAILDTGFAFRADFRKPDWWLPGQDGRASAGVLREVLPAYNRKAVFLGAGIDRIISPVWQVRVGLAAEASQVARPSAPVYQDYRLLGVPMSMLMNKANSDVDPTAGYRLQLDVTPYVDVGPSNDFFSIIRLTGRSYFDLAEPGRSVLALRASFGTIPTANIGGIPPDKLFYAGGGGSVRGFVYQSAGPRDAFNNPLGGASVVEASVEFRQRIGKSLGAVAFVDAGSAYPDMLPDFSLFTPRVGAGVGARYYTDFGPIRLDVGFPLNRRDGDPAFGVYVSLGQAF